MLIEFGMNRVFALSCKVREDPQRSLSVADFLGLQGGVPVVAGVCLPFRGARGRSWRFRGGWRTGGRSGCRGGARFAW